MQAHRLHQVRPLRQGLLLLPLCRVLPPVLNIMLLFPVVPKVIANSKLVYPKQKDKRRETKGQNGQKQHDHRGNQTPNVISRKLEACHWATPPMESGCWQRLRSLSAKPVSIFGTDFLVPQNRFALLEHSFGISIQNCIGLHSPFFKRPPCPKVLPLLVKITKLMTGFNRVK